MCQSISILLGSGFSVPMGYPTGKNLNEILSNCNENDFSFHTSGELCTSLDGSKPDFGYKNDYDVAFDFCKKLINNFKEKKGYFDYEKFYDYLVNDVKTDTSIGELIKPYEASDSPFEQLIHKTKDIIYPQLISHYLKDKDGNKFYDNAGHVGGPFFPGYTGILNCLKKLLENNLINVHTLNHDLFFERLNHSDWLNGELCDGFEELGSPFYGGFHSPKGDYHVRLERYTGKYNKRIRLFKIHGSLDYVIFYERNQSSFATPSNYLKIRQGVNISELYKEKKNDKGEFYYDHCFVNYHADFLTGTTSKIVRYQEPLLYKKLFELFRKNLKAAAKLIIIGYGGRDSEINNMLLKYFDYKNRPSYIIDPFAQDELKKLAYKMGSHILEKSLEDIQCEDIEV